MIELIDKVKHNAKRAMILLSIYLMNVEVFRVNSMLSMVLST